MSSNKFICDGCGKTYAARNGVLRHKKSGKCSSNNLIASALADKKASALTNKTIPIALADKNIITKPNETKANENKSKVYTLNDCMVLFGSKLSTADKFKSLKTISCLLSIKMLKYYPDVLKDALEATPKKDKIYLINLDYKKLLSLPHENLQKTIK